jgi:glycosyltransferase involved in cell wall biosynthesis
MSEPMFTIVLPTYNRAGVVLDAVQSVLAQTYANFELIIVDDRSTDDTPAVLAKVQDPRVTIVANRRSKGPAGARNTGIFLARGAWICQIDSDDLWPNDMLERLAVVIADAPMEVGIVYGSVAYLEIGTGNATRIRRAERAGSVHTAFLEDHFISHCSAALRTSALRDVGGYDEAFCLKEDSDLLLRMTERYEVLPVPDLVYIYRLGGKDQLTRENDEFLRSYKRYINKHAHLLAGHPRARHELLARVLYLSINAGDWSEAARTWLKLVPSMWEAPGAFLRAHRSLGSLVVDKTKGRLLQALHVLGFRDAHA